jgi:hypothetical protein
VLCMLLPAGPFPTLCQLLVSSETLAHPHTHTDILRPYFFLVVFPNLKAHDLAMTSM